MSVRYDYLRKLEICATFSIDSGIEPIKAILKQRQLVAQQLLKTTTTEQRHKELTNFLEYLNNHIEIYFGL